MSKRSAPRYLSVDDMAKAFEVDAKTIRAWEKAGKLPKPIRGIDGGGPRRWPVEVAAEAVRAAGYAVPAGWAS